MKIGNLEFRETTSLKNVKYFEIVYWQKENTCFTVASYKDNDINIIGSRFSNLTQEEKIDFTYLMDYGQKIQSAKFDIEEYIHEKN